jgi:hypothetical protein
MAEHKCNKETEIEIIKIKMDNMESKVNDIHKALVGNGKPGIITRMDKQEGALNAIKWIVGVSIPIFAIIISTLR